jgi:hypothetical protein
MKRVTNHRQLPFDRVVHNLKYGKYRGKIHGLDYANVGIQPFEEMKFAQQLGVTKQFLREIGLVQIKEFSGWHLPAEPSVDELLSCRKEIEKEIRRTSV